MEVRLLSTTGRRKVELTIDDATQTDTKSVRIAYNHDYADNIDKISEIATIKKIVLRRDDSEQAARLIDDYLLAGFSGRHKRPTYSYTERFNKLKKSSREKFFRATEDRLIVYDFYKPVLNGPSEEIDTLLDGHSSFQNKRALAIEATHDLEEELERRLQNLRDNRDTLDDLTPDELHEQYDGKFVIDADPDN